MNGFTIDSPIYTAENFCSARQDVDSPSTVRGNLAAQTNLWKTAAALLAMLGWVLLNSDE